MAAGQRWTRNELLLALHLYWRLPFGQQHSHHPAVVELAHVLNRTPSSVAMKLNNFTSLDPVEKSRGVVGLQGASALDREIWDWHRAMGVEAAAEMEALWQLQVEHQGVTEAHIVEPTCEIPTFAGLATSAQALATVRRGQEFFRRTVLANYQGKCALTGLGHRALLRASHIVGWAEAPEERVSVRNGIALNAIHDAAFDRHLMTFDEDGRMVIGKRLADGIGKSELVDGFLAYEGKPLTTAFRTAPNPELFARHRKRFLELEAA